MSMPLSTLQGVKFITRVPISQEKGKEEKIENPIVEAIQEGKTTDEIKNIIIQNSSLINKATKNGMTPLHLAFTEKILDPELIIALLDVGADINAKNKEGETPILNNKVTKEIFKYFLDFLTSKKVNLNKMKESKGNLLLIAAILAKNEAAALALIEYGVDINLVAKDKHFLLHIAEWGNINVVQALCPKINSCTAKEKICL